VERMNVEEQLLASKMEAEKAVTAKTTFLATMSHEIRFFYNITIFIFNC